MHEIEVNIPEVERNISHDYGVVEKQNRRQGTKTFIIVRYSLFMEILLSNVTDAVVMT